MTFINELVRKTSFISCVFLAALSAHASDPAALRAFTFNAGLLEIGNYAVVPMLRQRSSLMPMAIAEHADTIQADVVAIQEVWSDATARAIQAELEKRGYASYRRNLRFIVGNGLILAVRAPWTLNQIQLHLFKRATMAELFAKKGFILARIQNEQTGQRLTVITTHLQAQDTDDQGRPKNIHEVKAIKAQMDQIRAAVDAIPLRFHSDRKTLEREPVLLLGDLNTGPNSVPEAFEYLQTRAGFEDLNPKLLNTWDSANPLVQKSKIANKNDAMLDHCVVHSGTHLRFMSRETEMSMNAPTRFRLNGESIPLSDHYGLNCTFTLEDSIPSDLRLSVAASPL